ncbi:MAG TPA: SUMF1/EgtB/PvdO family nonheme iron enzyme [Pirellulales bacterium]|nr:SUMF1/EgtB/PvdO family nonheme iron enzyme [Pirellulales bacterium]
MTRGYSRFALSAVCAASFVLDPCGASAQGTRTNSVGIKLVLVPAGEYMMGAEEDPSDTLSAFPYARREWPDGELPRHRVRITKPFYMGAYEVTLGRFLTFYHSAKYKTDCEREYEYTKQRVAAEDTAYVFFDLWNSPLRAWIKVEASAIEMKRTWERGFSMG